MKVWKQLLGIALCLCMALCVIGVRGDAASGSEHSHPICGETHKDIGDHTGTCDSVTWTAWDGTDMDASENDIQLTEGNYYLSDTLTVEHTIHIRGTVSLCLNGKKLSGNTYGLIVLDENATLNICDCKGGGEIELSGSGDSSTITYDSQASSSNKLNLYGGTISRTGGSYISCVLKAATSSHLTFNMYGGYIHNNNEWATTAVNMHVATGTRTVSIYGGKIRNEGNYGIEMNGEGEQLYIAGGTLESRTSYAVFAVGGSQLILSGNPTIKTDNPSSGAICSPEDHKFKIKSDFEPKEPVSIFQSWGAGVFAVPAVTGGSLADKAQYFVSAEEGYFVECNSGGNLQLTACAITEEPAVGNGYTVTANGSPTYQWYSATKGPVPVTENIVERKGSLSYYWYGEWSTYSIPQTGKVTGFTLTMKAGDVLTLDFSRSDVWVERVAFSDGQRTITGVEDEDHWRTYTLTAPADGDYTLTISASAEPMGGEPSHTKLSFTATMTAYVPGDQLDGQTAATLNTTGLSGGSYICQVTWEGKTTLNSQVVSYTVLHEHDWATEWSSDGTHHWHECQNADCDVTDVSQKEGYGTHTEDDPVIENKVDATCTANGCYDEVVYCATCRAQLSRTAKTINALGHDFENGSYAHDADNHWKKCSRCDATDTQNPHDWNSSTVTIEATCTEPGNKHYVCSTCGATKDEAINALGHDYVHHNAKAATCTEKGWSAYYTCSRCDYTTYKEIAALGHDYVHHNAQAATCTAIGWNAYNTCSRCTYTTYNEIAATGHTWTPATCTAPKTCSVCRITDGEALGHDWGVWFVTTPATTERYGTAARTCRRDPSHTETRLIPKLEPEPSDGCKKDGACPLAAYPDLAATAWYHDGIHYCLENGLMQGVPGGAFQPGGNTTRAQLVTILWRQEGCPAVKGEIDFRDVRDGAWYADAVRWAAVEGIVRGYGDGRFAPDDTVSREQMATVLYRYAKYKGADVNADGGAGISGFADGAAVSRYAGPAMEWAYGNGLVSGVPQDGGTVLAPKDTTTRAQMAVLMMRFYTELMK